MPGDRQKKNPSIEYLAKNFRYFGENKNHQVDVVIKNLQKNCNRHTHNHYVRLHYFQLHSPQIHCHAPRKHDRSNDGDVESPHVKR